MMGHQLVVHEVGASYRGRDFNNPVGMSNAIIYLRIWILIMCG